MFLFSSPPKASCMATSAMLAWRGGVGKGVGKVLGAGGQALARVGARAPTIIQTFESQCPILCTTCFARETTRRLTSRVQVINSKTEGAPAEREVSTHSPGSLGGGGSSSSCGSGPAGPVPMSSKMEQKAIEELDDMSIIDEVRHISKPCLVYIFFVHASPRITLRSHTLTSCRLKLCIIFCAYSSTVLCRKMMGRWDGKTRRPAKSAGQRVLCAVLSQHVSAIGSKTGERYFV